jgi:hypothetical protein
MLGYQRMEGELTGAEGGGRGGAGSIELGEGEGEWPRLVWGKAELDGSFYKRPRRDAAKG